MVRIARHHIEGAHPLNLDTDFKPLKSWPSDVRVQWGSRRAFTRYGAEAVDRPAFFEAFLAGPLGVWFRGEGPVIATAEASAFEYFARYSDCEHQWERKYDEYSSVGVCSCCGTSGTEVFEAKDRLEPTDGPLTPSNLNMIAMGGLRPYRDRKLTEKWHRWHKQYSEAVHIKAERQGLKLPDLSLPDDEYEAACKEVVCIFWHANRDWYVDYAKTLPPPAHNEPSFMSPECVCCLDGDVKRWLMKGGGDASRIKPQ